MTEVKISESTALQQRIRDLEGLKSIEGKGSAAFSLIMLPPATITYCSASACMSYFAMAVKNQRQMAKELSDPVLAHAASRAVNEVSDIRSRFYQVPKNGLIIWSGCGVTTTGGGVTTTDASPEKGHRDLEVRSCSLIPDAPIPDLDEKTLVDSGLHHMYGTLTWTFGDRFFQLDEYLTAAKSQLAALRNDVNTVVDNVADHSQ
jgi:hypothetical protein